MRKTYLYSTVTILGIAFTGVTEGRGQTKLTPEAVVTSPVATPSEIPMGEFSKSIANKAFIGAGLGLASISGKKGDWASAFSGGFVIGYQLLENLFDGKVFGTFRYAPSDVVIDESGNSYSGVVEIYNFGGQWHRDMSGLNVLASAELSLISTNLSSQTLIEEDSSLEEGSANITLGGGADWSIFEKVKGGPRVYIGFGSLSYYQVGGEISFLL